MLSVLLLIADTVFTEDWIEYGYYYKVINHGIFVFSRKRQKLPLQTLDYLLASRFSCTLCWWVDWVTNQWMDTKCKRMEHRFCFFGKYFLENESTIQLYIFVYLFMFYIPMDKSQIKYGYLSTTFTCIVKVQDDVICNLFCWFVSTSMWL